MQAYSAERRWIWDGDWYDPGTRVMSSRLSLWPAPWSPDRIVAETEGSFCRFLDCASPSQITIRPGVHNSRWSSRCPVPVPVQSKQIHSQVLSCWGLVAYNCLENLQAKLSMDPFSRHTLIHLYAVLTSPLIIRTGLSHLVNLHVLTDLANEPKDFSWWEV